MTGKKLTGNHLTIITDKLIDKALVIDHMGMDTMHVEPAAGEQVHQSAYLSLIVLFTLWYEWYQIETREERMNHDCDPAYAFMNDDVTPSEEEFGSTFYLKTNAFARFMGKEPTSKNAVDVMEPLRYLEKCKGVIPKSLLDEWSWYRNSDDGEVCRVEENTEIPLLEIVEKNEKDEFGDGIAEYYVIESPYLAALTNIVLNMERWEKNPDFLEEEQDAVDKKVKEKQEKEKKKRAGRMVVNTDRIGADICKMRCKSGAAMAIRLVQGIASLGLRTDAEREKLRGGHTIHADKTAVTFHISHRTLINDVPELRAILQDKPKNNHDNRGKRIERVYRAAYEGLKTYTDLFPREGLPAYYEGMEIVSGKQNGRKPYPVPSLSRWKQTSLDEVIYCRHHGHKENAGEDSAVGTTAEQTTSA